MNQSLDILPTGGNTWPGWSETKELKIAKARSARITPNCRILIWKMAERSGPQSAGHHTSAKDGAEADDDENAERAKFRPLGGVQTLQRLPAGRGGAGTSHTRPVVERVRLNPGQGNACARHTRWSCSMFILTDGEMTGDLGAVFGDGGDASWRCRPW